MIGSGAHSSHRWRVVLSYLALIAFAIFSVYPITQIITIALRRSDQLLSTSLALIPDGATLENFRILLTQMPFRRWFGNSTLIAALAVTITGVALASIGGYSLSRFRFLVSRFILDAFLVNLRHPRNPR